MKDETKVYGYEAYEIAKYASTEIGSRLPGSKSEKKFADYMADKLREIGIEPKQEEFSVSPRASIGGVPYAGYYGIAASALVYLALGIPYVWYAIALSGVCLLLWLIFSVVLYKTWFDMFFKQRISQNTYGELLPPDGKYDYTIMLSAHTDTSWNWKHSEHNYIYRNKPVLGFIAAYSKVGFGALCVFFLIASSIAMTLVYNGVYFQSASAINTLNSASFNNFLFVMRFLPIVTAIGSAFVAMWADNDEEMGSRGAMDNATGIGLSYELTKYFKEHPEKMPKNCRIIDFNCGAEEAGLRGSMNFTKVHKGEDILKNVWNINIDSIADKDYFQVVIQDDWQFTRFDKDLEKMFKDTFAEMGIESKTGGCIHNPVGGADSTPLTRAGIKSVTFAAQEPVLTYYYHTFRDTIDRFEPETVALGFDVVLSVIEKIDAFQQEHGFNGVNNK